MALTDGLIAYWKLDETSGTVTSDIGTHNGTVTNALQNQTGILGKAITFDGDGDYVSFGDDASFDFGTTQDFAISFWIKTTQSTEGFVFCKMTSGSAPGFAVEVYDGQFWAFIRSDSAQYVDVNSTALVNSGAAWFHCVANFDRDGNLTIYVNNTQEDSASIAGVTTTINNANNLLMGARDDASPYYFAGSLDEVGVWNRLLTTDEISALYNSGSGYNGFLLVGFDAKFNKFLTA